MHDYKILRSIHDFLEATIQRDFDHEDPIRLCDPSLLSLLSVSPEVAREEAYKKLYEFPYKDVPECWRRLYTEACLWIALDMIEVTMEEMDPSCDPFAEKHDHRTWKIVEEFDKAIIMTGAPGRRDMINRIFQQLAGLDCIAISAKVFVRSSTDAAVPMERTPKRQKTSHELETDSKTDLDVIYPTTYPASHIPAPRLLHRPFLVVSGLSLRGFQERLEHDHKKNGLEGPLPLIIEGAIEQWPAFQEPNSWKSPRYLLSKTLGGRRLVPIEIGRSYTDANWSQRIVTFREFLERYMLGLHSDHFTFPSQTTEEQDLSPTTDGVGYLAQHDLFSQIPSLRDDIRIPDYCYSVPPAPTTATQGKDDDDANSDGEIMVNAWFGPVGTMTPLHTDPHHNILAQVVGSKYVRLYAPSQTARLYPRGKNELGIDMSNTSSVDLDEALEILDNWRWASTADGKPQDGDSEAKLRNSEEGPNNGSGGYEWSQERQRIKAFRDRFPDFEKGDYVEGILSEGQCLFIPKGWWHYVRSLSPSFSVSFWWD
jgi:lysine-specific demethylase 8